MMMATDKVAGVPIIVRGIMTLSQAGLDCLTLIIAESQSEKILTALSRYEEQRLPEIKIVTYDEPYRVSPEVVKQVAAAMAKRSLVINANLLFDKELVETLCNSGASSDETVVCREGVHPLPVMEIPRAAWESLTSFTELKARSIESCLRQMLEAGRQRVAQKPADVNTFLVKRRRDRAVAEKFLTEAIRHSTGGPVAKYINKRISLPVSVLLSKLWVSPNGITAFNIVIGVFSGVFAADGHRYDVILLGAVLFQIASIVDGCDGEVAKLTFRASKFGQYIDSLSDNLSLGSFMTGLIAGYWRSTHSPVAFSVGAVMIFSTAITLFWMIRYLKRNTQSASLVTYDKEYLQKLSGQPRWLTAFIKYGKYTLKKDVFSFAFLLFALAGVLYWWLFIAAFGTAVSAAILTYLNFKELRERRSARRKEHGRCGGEVGIKSEGQTA
ncbi:MAG TPA: CDP-alcohol phosphatidyltransferase family protein [bacterium]|nr:CDP-alcohol phosphatidyltransferase family protein [bacterium]